MVDLPQRVVGPLRERNDQFGLPKKPPARLDPPRTETTARPRPNVAPRADVAPLGAVHPGEVPQAAMTVLVHQHGTNAQTPAAMPALGRLQSELLVLATHHEDRATTTLALLARTGKAPRQLHAVPAHVLDLVPATRHGVRATMTLARRARTGRVQTPAHVVPDPAQGQIDRRGTQGIESPHR